MKKKYAYLGILLIIFLAVFCSCDKDSPTSPKSSTPLLGNWSGTDISFTVGNSPLSVSSLKFTYSGHASGAYCSFNYKTTTTLSTKIKIESNSFSYTSSSYTIKGRFSDNKNAEIKISWDVYDSYCMAYYSGSKTYTASHKGLTKTISPTMKDDEEVKNNEEVIEFIEEGLKTSIKKDYDKVK